MKVHENCFAGEWKDSSLRVRVSTAVGVPTTNYSDSHLHSISADKMANKFTMYERFISHDCRPVYKYHSPFDVFLSDWLDFEF